MVELKNDQKPAMPTTVSTVSNRRGTGTAVVTDPYSLQSMMNVHDDSSIAGGIYQQV